jgi:hypothetical protein
VKFVCLRQMEGRSGACVSAARPVSIYTGG